MRNINFFLDSNVVIGYIFTLDSLNKLSKETMKDGNSCHFSLHVRKEVIRVFRRKSEEYKNFFLRLCDFVRNYNKSEFLSKSTIHNAIDKFERIGKLDIKTMHKVLDRIWEMFGFGENQLSGTILSKLTKFTQDSSAEHYHSKVVVLNKIKQIPNHSLKDETVLNLIEKENIRRFFHKKDEEILFDLNEYAKEHPKLDLCLVSWDDDFIDAVRILSNQLSFKKYIGRKFKSV